MKLIIKNDSKETAKNPNVKIIETTEASFTNQTVFIEENDVPIIKYTDTESMYFVKDLDNLYDRKSRSEVLLDITIDNLELIGSGSGGDFIPLTGTEAGNHVTGDIEFENGIDEGVSTGKISVDDSGEIIALVSSDGTSFVSPYAMYLNLSGDVSFINNNPDGFGIDGNRTDYKGLSGQYYYGANYDDNTYVQKKYVDDNFARVGTVAPISATDTGTTGEIRVTPTFIYTCVATDTWVRAAVLAW